MSDRQQPPHVRPLFRLPWRSRRRVIQDVDDELRFHIEHVAAELCAAGWSAADARQEAIRRFGDLEFTRHYCRAEDLRREQEKRRMTFVDELRQDLRYALRSLRASPGFTSTALLTLALGIGANTAIFSVVRGVLLEPLPFHDADRLVRVWHSNPAGGIEHGAVSEPDFLDWRAQSSTAESMGGYWYTDGLSGLDLTGGGGSPERLQIALVTDGFFETLGTPARYGRSLGADDQIEGRNRVVVISHGFWMRRFGGDQSLIGGTITLNGEPFHVAGIMPPRFTYPATRAIDGWIPVSYFGPDDIGRSRGAHFLSVIARPKPGVSEGQLQSELAGIAARLEQQHPENPGWTSATTAPIADSIIGEVQRPLIVLMFAVAMLLLIACINIASLLLARASGRQRELALRAALGAGRGRIARQLLTESLTLALLGGALGVGLGILAVRAFAASAAGEIPRMADVRVDAVVLAFTLLLTIAAGLAFGLAPTVRASGDLEGSLRAGARGSVGAGGQTLRSVLVVAEVALAVVLVVGAGLMTKSFARLVSVDPGFETSNALVVMMSVPERYDDADAMRSYYYSVLEAIRAVPGVRAAGSIRDLPLLGHGEMVRPSIAGRPTPPEGEPAIQLHHISTDYFDAIGTPIIAGRDFEMTDRLGVEPVTIINEELARRAWPGQDAVGRALRFGQTEIRVIGVVGDVRQSGLAEPVEPAMYLHVLQNQRSRMSIVVRVQGNPEQYAGAVRQAIWARDPAQTITSIRTLEDVTGGTVARPRLLAWLLGVFGAIGLSLGALGIFGVLAYAVSQRRQEIGVRVALGATPRSVLQMIVGRGMVLALAGVTIGILGAMILTQSLRSVLFGIEPADPVTFIQVTLVLLGAALLASWLPARRALAIDPVTALRTE